jgi:hypothetical protein
MQADFSVLKQAISDVIQKSAIGARVTDVVLEADRDDEGEDFLRVILEVKPLDDVANPDLAAVVESIEKTIGDLDDRFPSVRFADAA